MFLTSTYLNSAKVLQKTIDILNEKILKAKPVAQGKDWSIMVIIQPWPKIFWQRTQSNGVGNVLGLDRFDDNMLRMFPSSVGMSHANIDVNRGFVRLLLGQRGRRCSLPVSV